jgi:hypothetical protein
MKLGITNAFGKELSLTSKLIFGAEISLAWEDGL